MNYSMTQAGNLTAFAALIVFVFRMFNFDVAHSDMLDLVNAVAIAGGIVVSYVGRFRKGDLKVTGGRK